MKNTKPPENAAAVLAHRRSVDRERMRRWREQNPERNRARVQNYKQKEKRLRDRYRAEYDALCQSHGFREAARLLRVAHEDEWRNL